MPNCRWKAFLLLGAFLFTLTTLLYAHYYVLDFLFHDGDLQQRPLVNRSAFQEQDETVKKVEIEAGPCTLRQTVEADGKLRQRFNFTVPVFLWAEHFSPTEWQRLQRDFPPYGWKGLPKEVVNSTLHLLNETTNKGLFADGWDGDCIRCAVVGNGGILNGSKQGKAIDGHDLVFRLNGAVTKGFEEDVGTKISFYGFTTNTMKNSLIAYRKFGFERVPQQQGLQYIFIPSDIRDYVMLNSAIQGVPVPLGHDQWDIPSKYFGPNPSSKNFKMLHPDFLQYIKDRFLRSRLLQMYDHLYMPTTGALMLFTALHTCDQVTAYGFITDNYRDFSDHYYDVVKKPLIFYANHDMQLEAQLWKRLASLRVLQLYTREAPVPVPRTY